METLGRTYNQLHIPRKYQAGKRRFSIYLAWSYPGEANADIHRAQQSLLDNDRGSPRGVAGLRNGSVFASNVHTGDTGTLELFFLSLQNLQTLVGEVTGYPVAVDQRVDQAGQKLPIDERILADTDTLLVFGLDHMVTEQEAAPEEIAALKDFLKRDGTCLIIGPHHDVGASDDPKVRNMEYFHHGDPLVPRQQRFGRYERSLMRGLGVPVENRYGLRPATLPGTTQTVALSTMNDLDRRGWLENVKTFVFHMHLPHYALTDENAKDIHVLARQPVDLSKPHPFTEAGNREFNMFLWMPPSDERAGDLLLADSTIFLTLFGGDGSLQHFWRNLATK